MIYAPTSIKAVNINVLITVLMTNFSLRCLSARANKGILSTNITAPMGKAKRWFAIVPMPVRPPWTIWLGDENIFTDTLNITEPVTTEAPSRIIFLIFKNYPPVR